VDFVVESDRTHVLQIDCSWKAEPARTGGSNMEGNASIVLWVIRGKLCLAALG
jgi:hypothetical protein